MSFFAASNFASPLINKTHLVTIILVAALFGAFRWSQGRIVIESVGSHAPKNFVSSPYLGNRGNQGSTVSEGEDTSSSDEAEDQSESAPAKSLNQILSDQQPEEAGEPKKPKSTQSDEESSSGTSLKDIEARLGLR